MPLTAYDIGMRQSGTAIVFEAAIRRPVPNAPWVVPPSEYLTYRLNVDEMIAVTPREERRALTRDEQLVLSAALRANSELVYEF